MLRWDTPRPRLEAAFGSDGINVIRPLRHKDDPSWGQVVVSSKESFPDAVSDVELFLRKYSDVICSETVEGNGPALDIPVTSKHNIMVRNYLLPCELLGLLHRAQIALCVSRYDP